MADETSTTSDNTTPSDSSFDPVELKADQLYKTGKTLYQNVGSRQFSTFEDSLHGFDSIRNTIYMPETEHHGFTFFTRPKLNLSTPSIRSDRILSLLDTLDTQTVAFTIRALLDTKLKELYGISADSSPFFNAASPFIPILSNRLFALNGWPDPTLDVETTEGGFFSESITYPKGHDQLSRNYDISASFVDVQGSVVHNIILMWLRWIHLATRGLVTAYVEDIEQRRMCFTSSIYRFVMDPSSRFITKWAKATGCFPHSVPSGAYFNYDATASHVDVAMNLSVPFTVAGKIEYMDPIILKEFNMLAERYSSNIKNLDNAKESERLLYNFQCLPYIDLTSGTNELLWKFRRPQEAKATASNQQMAWV